MSYYPDFAELLEENLTKHDRTLSWLANRLDVSASTVSRWLNHGSRPGSPELVVRIADILQIEKAALLIAAGYGYRETPEADQNTSAIDPVEKSIVVKTKPDDKQVDKKANEESVDNYPERKTQLYDDVIINSFAHVITTLRTWNENIFRWSEASDHDRSSRAGMLMYALSAIGRTEPKHIFHFLGVIVLWFVTASLIGPILDWPHTDSQALLINCIFYGVATWLIPLVVSLFTVPDRIEMHHIPTSKKQRELWMLKFTGAMAGFSLFSAIAILMGLLGYYVGFPFSSWTMRGSIALVPLLFSYVVARRMPANHLEMYKGEFKLHDSMRFFFIFFLCFGPMLALLWYVFAGLLNIKTIGLSIFVGIGLVISFWEYKKNSTYELPDPIAILFLGVILPVAFIGLVIVVTAGYSETLDGIVGFNYLDRLENPSILFKDSLDIIILFIAILIYGFSESILLATLLVRNRAKIPEKETVEPILFFEVLGFQTLLIMVAGLYGLWHGIAMAVFLVVMWYTLGRKMYAESNLWIHPSYWLMQFSIVLSLHLLKIESLQWLNGPLFLLVASIIIRWAYQKPFWSSIRITDIY